MFVALLVLTLLSGEVENLSSIQNFATIEECEVVLKGGIEQVKADPEVKNVTGECKKVD